MGDRVTIQYSFGSAEEWQESKGPLKEIIQQDTGAEVWVETRSMPPIGSPPPVTRETVEKLKALPGVNVTEL
ncbi:hypothetical protein NM208_g11686 [Fusarium decemcellulare]|uniref:Uncharacterized protein n=1 Tax=Fusarium decemcellulare TaxID=57161 RepID=A0ACC1RUN7_9HYPO|nr:hypothetical protein NM208_g11686 [Fusarium decemcellulare]